MLSVPACVNVISEKYDDLFMPVCLSKMVRWPVNESKYIIDSSSSFTCIVLVHYNIIVFNPKQGQI